MGFSRQEADQRPGHGRPGISSSPGSVIPRLNIYLTDGSVYFNKYN